MDKDKDLIEQLTAAKKEVLWLNSKIADRQKVIDAQATIGEWTRETAWGKMTSKVYHLDAGLYEYLYTKTMDCLKAEKSEKESNEKYKRLIIRKLS